MSFRLYFNKRRQFVLVQLHDVNPETFKSKNSTRWGYYQANKNRTKAGLFGEIHLVKSRVREDLVAHELIHLLGDVLRSKDRRFSEYNEEYIAELFDNWTRQFFREYKKLS